MMDSVMLRVARYAFCALAAILPVNMLFAQEAETSSRVISLYDTLIYDDAHAKEICAAVATQHNGRWTGLWDIRQDENGYGYSICELEIAHTSNLAPSTGYAAVYGHENTLVSNQLYTRSFRDERDALSLCMDLALQNSGRWTGRYGNTGDGRGMCEIETGRDVQVGGDPTRILDVNAMTRPTTNAHEQSAYDILMGLTPTQ